MTCKSFCFEKNMSTNNCNLYKALRSSLICLLWLAKRLNQMGLILVRKLLGTLCFIRFFKFLGQRLALQLICNKKKDYKTAVQ